MKRDLKKWLKEKSFENLDYDPKMVGVKLDDMSHLHSAEYIKKLYEDHGVHEATQIIWCAGQKQFLKDILDDIDNLIDKTFNGSDQVVGDKARHVAEEANLKTWLYNKYKYLQGKNGK